MDYAKAFRLVRAAYGLQQTQLAERLSISRSYVSLIESGQRTPNLALIQSLARELRIPRPLVDLLAYEKDDLKSVEAHDMEVLARSLLSLLAAASDSDIQQRLPLAEKS